jgi:hypothetical protein
MWFAVSERNTLRPWRELCIDVCSKVALNWPECTFPKRASSLDYVVYPVLLWFKARQLDRDPGPDRWPQGS